MYDFNIIKKTLKKSKKEKKQRERSFGYFPL